VHFGLIFTCYYHLPNSEGFIYGSISYAAQVAPDLAAQISAHLSVTGGAQKWLQGTTAGDLPLSFITNFLLSFNANKRTP
jgi:hypothetical protein